LAGKIGGVVVIEDDKPAFVVLSYDKFNELTSLNPGKEDLESFSQELLSPEDEAVESLNKEVMALSEEIESKESKI